MVGIAALWILLLLSAGAFALDRVLTSAITRNFDEGLDYVLTSIEAGIGFKKPLIPERANEANLAKIIHLRRGRH